MAPGDKELLLKDICARLPYDVKVAWHCGFEYVTSYYIAKDQLKINDKKA